MCNSEVFSRNHYFTGKLLVERDFRDEQSYHVKKIRHHNRHLHGWGVVCGLKVVQHESDPCKSSKIVVRDGVAVDKCGRDIIVPCAEAVDITDFSPIKALIEAEDPGKYDVSICVRYKECPTEPIPVLYDDCSCDESRVAPNRILEGYKFEVRVSPSVDGDSDSDEDGGDGDSYGDDGSYEDGTGEGSDGEESEGDPDGEGDGSDTMLCTDGLWTSLESCDQEENCCDSNDDLCIELAVIRGYVAGSDILDEQIDNRVRRLLPSVSSLFDTLKCVEQNSGGGGGTGPVGPKGEKGEKGDIGPQGLKGEAGAVGPAGSAGAIGPTGPVGPVGPAGQAGATGPMGPIGPVGQTGPRGPQGRIGEGLEEGLTRIDGLSWVHNGYSELAKLYEYDEFSGYGIVIHFSEPVRWRSIDRNVFQVLVDETILSPNSAIQFARKLCILDLEIYPVECALPVDPNSTAIDKANILSTDDEFAQAIAVRIDMKLYYRLTERGQTTLYPMLKGDFVIDKNGKAIDAEFVRAQLPTGDRPDKSEFGIQGGVFESWFAVNNDKDS